MEIRHVREFLALTKTKSYFEASERMFVTPSSLTRHIRALENELGVPLFEHATRKVILTGYGKSFLPYAMELLRVDDDCTAAFSEALDHTESTVAIGSIPLMRAYHIMDLVSTFQTENKSVRLDIHEAYSSLLIPRLRNEELDFAFLRDKDDEKGEFDKILFADDSLCAVVSRKHPLAAGSTIPVIRLRDEPLLMIGKNPFLYKICTDLCLQAGFKPHVRFTSHQADTLIEMADQGMGIALLMRKPAALIAPDTVRLMDITPTAKTIIYLARNVHHRMTKQAWKFWEMARQLKSQEKPRKNDI